MGKVAFGDVTGHVSRPNSILGPGLGPWGGWEGWSRRESMWQGGKKGGKVHIATRSMGNAHSRHRVRKPHGHLPMAA
jgi:hypothetical protein